MGVDYYAYAIMGVRLHDIPPKTIKMKKKAFDHDYPRDYKVDPKTGKDLWLDEEEEVPTGTAAYEFDSDRHEENPLGPLPIFHEFQVAYSTDDKDQFIGVITNLISSNGDTDWEFKTFPDIAGIAEIREKLKNLLEPFGLWHEDEFGLYSVLHCSY